MHTLTDALIEVVDRSEEADVVRLALAALHRHEDTRSLADPTRTGLA